MKKLRNDRGETLLEVLVAIVIAALSVTLLLGCISAAANVDAGVKEKDEQIYAALNAAEEQKDEINSITVTITNEDPTIDPEPSVTVAIYGGDDGPYSYKRK